MLAVLTTAGDRAGRPPRNAVPTILRFSSCPHWDPRTPLPRARTVISPWLLLRKIGLKETPVMMEASEDLVEPAVTAATAAKIAARPAANRSGQRTLPSTTVPVVYP